MADVVREMLALTGVRSVAELLGISESAVRGTKASVQVGQGAAAGSSPQSAAAVPSPAPGEQVVAPAVGADPAGVSS